MNYHYIYIALFVWLFVDARAKSFSFERNNMEDIISCTPGCSDRTIRTFYGAPCSCSGSCLVYGDCCQNAPYQNTGNDLTDFGCIMLYGLGPISVVNGCPSSSNLLTETCDEAPGTSIPVTSLETGISYSTYNCALCNNDSYSIISWPVELRCCPDEEEETGNITAASEKTRHQQSSDGGAPISKAGEVLSEPCDCMFYAQDNLKFAMSLELRKCAPVMISTCSSDWTNDNTRKLCVSYMDPVHIGERVYRNSYCATCNFEDIELLKCSVVRSLPMHSKSTERMSREIGFKEG